MVRVVFIALLGAACLWGGVPALSLALTNWSPAVSTCAAYEPPETSARWVHLSACFIDPSQAAYTTVGRTVTEVYLPVWPEGSGRGGTTGLVLASRRPEHIALGEALLAARDPASRRAAFQAHAVRPGDELSGVVRRAGSLGSSEERTLEALAGVLRPDYVVVDDEATPDLRLGVGLTLAGLLLMALALQAHLVSRRTRCATSSVASDEAGC
jgi:hypothetical protein